MPSHRIVAARTALLVYDMTNDRLAPGGKLEVPQGREVVVPRLLPLIECCRQTGVTVAFVRHLHDPAAGASPDEEVYSPLGCEPSDWMIDKRSFNAFWGTDLEARLRKRGIDTLIITGCSTAVGCETTAREAATRGFKVVFTADGTVTRPLADIGWGAFSEDHVHRLTLTILGHVFARIAYIGDVIREIATDQVAEAPQG